ncbi:MAG: hypothetical protein ACLTR5_05525 [Oscillospiraceae bacterium]
MPLTELAAAAGTPAVASSAGAVSARLAPLNTVPSAAAKSPSGERAAADEIRDARRSTSVTSAVMHQPVTLETHLFCTHLLMKIVSSSSGCILFGYLNSVISLLVSRFVARDATKPFSASMLSEPE